MTLHSYYQKRAPTYEQAFEGEDHGRQMEIAEITKDLQSAMEGRDVLDVACGTGFWTVRAAETAKSIVAVDAVQETLDVAQEKTYRCPVDFKIGDAYALESITGKFNGGMTTFWFSHVPKSRIHEFLSGLHAALKPGSTVFIAENMYVPGRGGELITKPGEEDTYKRRTLPDKSVEDVLKNYYSEEELRKIFSPFAHLKITMKKCYWWVQYSI